MATKTSSATSSTARRGAGIRSRGGSDDGKPWAGSPATDLGCKQLITTEALSVVQFDDPVAAQRYVDAFDGNAHLNGPIVLQYAAAQTPTEQWPAYEARLAGFLAQQQ